MARHQRYIKLQEFPAHEGTNVNCVKIGPKSSGVLVTGGDDRKVNLWTIGAQTKVLALSGHQAAVESVTFDQHEEMVAAGASNGSIKLFDLDKAKVSRSWTGHRANVLCLELSEHGLLSGSMDTNVKLWDLRGRESTSTFKGHKAAVRHVKFSPDGKWVASASDDGQVKIWDLTADKLICELAGHTHAVTGLHFHPREYLLATCSVDKTVKLWDLESFSLLETTPPEATGVRAMALHPDGQHMFSAVQEGLRVWSWSWEPPCCTQHDVVDMPWYKVADISVLAAKNKLVGCSFNQAFVGMWVVDLKDVQPFGGEGGRHSEAAGSRDNMVVAKSDSDYQAKSYHRDRGSGASASTGTTPYGSHQRRAGNEQPQAAPAGVRSQSRGRADARAGLGNGRAGHSVLQDPPVTVLAPSLNRYNSLNAGGANRYSGAAAAAGDSIDAYPPAAVSRQAQAAPSAAAPSKSGMVSVGVGVGDSLLRGQDPVQMARDQVRLAPAAQQAAKQSFQEDVGPSPQLTDTDILAEINGRHDQVKSALAFRLSNLQLARNFLQRGDMRGALAAVRRCGDATVGADLLTGLLARREAGLTLDLVPELVPVLEQVLYLRCERQVQAGLEMATMVYHAFHQIIRDTCSQAARVGVDLSFEQRREKCMTARISLQGLAPKLGHVARLTAGSSTSYKAQSLAAELATF